jgi:hypothetical protein
MVRPGRAALAGIRENWERIFGKFPSAGLGPQYVRAGTRSGPESNSLPPQLDPLRAEKLSVFNW